MEHCQEKVTLQACGETVQKESPYDIVKIVKLPHFQFLLRMGLTSIINVQ